MKCILKVRSTMLLVFGMTTIYADTLSGGAIYGGPEQGSAVCYLFNAGIGSVKVTTRSIYEDGTNTPVILSSDNCSSLLKSGATCSIAKELISTTHAYSCKMVISPTGANIRGTLELRRQTEGMDTIRSTELR